MGLKFHKMYINHLIKQLR